MKKSMPRPRALPSSYRRGDGLRFLNELNHYMKKPTIIKLKNLCLAAQVGVEPTSSQAFASDGCLHRPAVRATLAFFVNVI